MRRILPVLSLAATSTLLVSAVACRTTTEEASLVVEEAQAPDGLPVAAPSAPECPPEAVDCGQNEAPVLCTAGAYAGRALPESLVVRAWGRNACAGRLALAKAACARQLRPSLLGQAQCVPDASGGHCPPAPAVCTREVAPTLCTAGRYAEQALSDDQAIKAWGGNPCLARLALIEAACRSNLDPSALGKVTCAADPQAGECPPIEARCGDTPRASVCEVRRMVGTPLTKPVEAKGDSACEAKQHLMRLLCRQGLKPSDVEEVVCRFGR